ncbi:hypothetical protein DCAR_0625931 [Daucus carota subsp. sativus]|uniref:Uncharacterized protein n=1 Tax=Daucus carota subsp. sativus TaxID=79200 RepID=A0AAF1B6J1_DAUCS|nr:hypothetical protein DCAR_0625931 [Daucus carota subsp. sativus]
MAQTCTFQLYFVMVTVLLIFSALLNISMVGAQDSATAPLPDMDAGNASDLRIYGGSVILAFLIAVLFQ